MTFALVSQFQIYLIWVNTRVNTAPSSPTVANTDAFILSKNQQSFSSQLAAELR